MKDYLKRTGLAACIVITIAATAFLPKRISQTVILVTLLVWCGTYVFGFLKKHAGSVHREKPCRKAACDHSSAELHLSHRITDKLQSAYPNATWRWKYALSPGFVEDGGKARIETRGTDEYNEAEITVDGFGRIGIEMIRSKSINEAIKDADEKADVTYTSDVSVWYDVLGKKILTEMISELNAKGNKSLSVSEDGSIMVGEAETVGSFPSFPSKNLWSKLAQIIEGEGLRTVCNEASIEIGW